MTAMQPELLARPQRGSAAALVLVACGLLASALSVYAAARPSVAPLLNGYLCVDASSRLFLAFVNPIFLGIAVYVWSRLQVVPELGAEMKRFVPLAIVLLVATNVVFLANKLYVMWIALECTALAATLLIVRPHSPASRQASFHYLLFSSVGLGLVLLGFTCLARSDGASGELFISEMQSRASGSADRWEKLGVALMLLGLGTKLGLAPMYSWLPEAYDEAPPAVTALLGAVQFNATLLMIFRVVEMFRPGCSQLVSSELMTMGVMSMLVSTFNIVAVRNVKRLVAYASINHAGVIAIGLAIGDGASYGVLLYVLSNAFIKAILFLTCGKIKDHYRTKDTRKISGLLKDLPYSGLFLMIGTFALLGFPPFGSFFGELLILSALVSSNHMFVFATFCVLITVTFVATGRTIFPMIWGEPQAHAAWPRQTLLSAWPKVVFLLALVVLGVYIPQSVNQLIREVAASLGQQ
jgi:hydrogenase-4 component F